jgi:hypothetical protein
MPVGVDVLAAQPAAVVAAAPVLTHGSGVNVFAPVVVLRERILSFSGARLM